MKVKDVMIKKVLTTGPDTIIKEAAKTLADNHIGSLVVVKDKKPIGILTERDILCALAESRDSEASGIGSKKVGNIMTNYVISIAPSGTVQEAVTLMAENKVKKLPVMDRKGKLVGIITASDIIIAGDIATARPGLVRHIKRLLVGKGNGR
jgi:CBS domain-containing protein